MSVCYCRSCWFFRGNRSSHDWPNSPTLLVGVPADLLLTVIIDLVNGRRTGHDREDALPWPVYVAGFVLIGTTLLLRNPGYADRLFYWLGWLIIITGILSIWWFYQDHSFPMDRLKAIGQLQHSGFAAILYGLVGLYHFMSTPQLTSTNAWHRWLPGTLAACMGLAVIILAQSRGGLVALSVVLLLGGIITRQRRFLVSLVLVALSLMVMAFLWSDELLTMVTRGGWDSYRLDIWRQALALIKAGTPVRPRTAGKLRDQHRRHIDHHPHNILLSTVLYGGMLAGGLLLLLIGLVLRQGWQSWSTERDLKPLLLTVFGFTYLMTDGYRLISNPVPNWVYFWLPVIWAISRELRDQPHGDRN